MTAGPLYITLTLDVRILEHKRRGSPRLLSFGLVFTIRPNRTERYASTFAKLLPSLLDSLRFLQVFASINIVLKVILCDPIELVYCLSLGNCCSS